MKPSFAIALPPSLVLSWTGSFPKVDVSILFAGDELTKSRQEGWDGAATGQRQRKRGARSLGFKSVTLTAGQLQDGQSPHWPGFVGRSAIRLETRMRKKLEYVIGDEKD